MIIHPFHAINSWTPPRKEMAMVKKKKVKEKLIGEEGGDTDNDMSKNEKHSPGTIRFKPSGHLVLKIHP